MPMVRLLKLSRTGRPAALTAMVICAVLVFSVRTLAESKPVRTSEDTGEQSFRVTQTVHFDVGDLAFTKRDGFDVVEMPGCCLLPDVGQPQLPLKEIRVALPEGMRAEVVRVTECTTEEISGRFSIMPAQPARYLSGGDLTADWVEPDARTYSSDVPYPADVVALSYQTDLAGQGIAVISLRPLRYIPASRKLLFHASITLSIEGGGGYACGDYLPPVMSKNAGQTYESLLKNMVTNPGDVRMRNPSESSSGAASGRRDVDPGRFDYVIITKHCWMNDFQPLADWKTRKGVPAKIVSTSHVFNSGLYGEPDDSEQDKIREFVIHAHQNWGASFFLLGGDADDVPPHRRGSGQYVNDTYYADYDDDWLCEVHLGRASVEDSTDIETFIAKVFCYERWPADADYLKVGLFGFWLNSHNYGEDVKTEINNNYIPLAWDVTTVFDSHDGNHSDHVIEAIEAGQNLMNHIDHGSTAWIGTGLENHGWVVSKADVDALVNSQMGVFYSCGCSTCSFTGDVIAEHFLRNPSGGSVAYIGCTELTSSISFTYDELFFSSLFDENHYKLGVCFSDHKNDGPKDYGPWLKHYQILTLLGDPEMSLWTGQPAVFDDVSCPASVNYGVQAFSVQVLKQLQPVRDALVCVMKENEIYEVGPTDVSGHVEFTINPLSTGDMSVTVTKQNMIPWEGTCLVTNVSGDMPETIDASISAVPGLGTVPFESVFTARVTNLTHQYRSVSMRVDALLADGTSFAKYKAGSTNLNPYELFTYFWNDSIPGDGSTIGDNVFRFNCLDVTPAPYNQPPCAQSGYTDTGSCTVTGTAP